MNPIYVKNKGKKKRAVKGAFFSFEERISPVQLLRLQRLSLFFHSVLQMLPCHFHEYGLPDQMNERRCLHLNCLV